MLLSGVTTRSTQRSGEVGGVSPVERSSGGTRLDSVERSSGRSLHSRLSSLATTAVRRARSIAAGAMVAGLLIGAAAPAQAQQRITPNTPAITATIQVNAEQRAAVQALRTLHEQGRLERMFERDDRTGAYRDATALATFAKLPVIGPETTPEQLVALGLITELPKGLDRLEAMPRYFVGKQVLVRTTASSDRNGRDWNYYKADGEQRITHRARIAGEDGDNFIVDVDKSGGGTQRIEVPKREIYELNQASSPSGVRDNTNGVEINYEDPVVRAKIAQGFFIIGDDLAKLDFTKPAGDARNRRTRLEIVNKLFWNQKSEYVRDHHKDWQRVINMSNLLNGGVGVCTDQGTTQWAYFQPFEQIAGFRILNIAGATIDLDRGHNFNVLWLTGSEEMFITDRTWNGGNEHVPVEDAMGAAGWNRNRYIVSPNARTAADLEIKPGHVRLRN